MHSNFLKFIQGPKQFIIPIYQRPYSWTTRQCEQLWNDIINASDDSSKGHFIGSIVYIQGGIYQSSTISQLVVIDGQQRLVTLSLLLKALGKALDISISEGSINSKKINNYYLVNNEEEDASIRHKLVLAASDNDTLISLIEGAEVPKNYSQKIVQNYGFFENMILKNQINPIKLFEGINKLFIVDISLERGNDNPQLIFESLNSTGLDLSQADLIRNYVLMGLEPTEQIRLYNAYWHPMENDFTQEEYIEYFNRFIRDYLTIKLGRIPNIGEVYSEFKSFVELKHQTNIEEVIKDVRYYSKLFVKLALEKEDDKEILSAIQDINDLRVEVSYPFIIEVLDDYSKGLITREDTILILRMIESYVLRRAICGIPTNSLNKTFATLLRDIDKSNYLEGIKAHFLLMESYKKFPSDIEFRSQFPVVSIYNFRVAGYVLGKLENFRHGKEPISVENYTIEHIMPQKIPLSQSWVDDLGQDWERVHQDHLHTIGNLTLTGYNSELGNLSFLEKRDRNGGFKSSSLQLNSELANLDHWNQEEIQKRAQVLTEQALRIWPVPQLDSSILQRYGVKGEDESLTYSEQDHFDYGSQTTNWLYDTLKSKLLAISDEIKVVPRKRYIAFLRYTNFLDIVFYRNQLNLYFNMRKGSLEDPQKMAEDVSDTGHWGNGDYRVIIHDATDMEYLLSLIKQSFDKNYLVRKAMSSETDMNLQTRNVTYSENYHLEKCDNSIKDIYHQTKNVILSISPGIVVKANKYYIAFINKRNFIYLKTRRSKLQLDLSLKKGELYDPRHIAIDTSTSQQHNPCEYSLIVDGKSDLVYIHSLIRQAYDKN